MGGREEKGILADICGVLVAFGVLGVFCFLLLLLLVTCYLLLVVVIEKLGRWFPFKQTPKHLNPTKPSRGQETLLKGTDHDRASLRGPLWCLSIP